MPVTAVIAMPTAEESASVIVVVPLPALMKVERPMTLAVVRLVLPSEGLPAVRTGAEFGATTDSEAVSESWLKGDKPPPALALAVLPALPVVPSQA